MVLCIPLCLNLCTILCHNHTRNVIHEEITSSMSITTSYREIEAALHEATLKYLHSLQEVCFHDNRRRMVRLCNVVEMVEEHVRAPLLKCYCNENLKPVQLRMVSCPTLQIHCNNDASYILPQRCSMYAFTSFCNEQSAFLLRTCPSLL